MKGPSLIRQRFADIPVILIAAFGGSRVAEETFRRGVTRYLEKPFGSDRFPGGLPEGSVKGA